MGAGANDQFRRLVESSPDGILITRDFRVEFLNPAAVRLFGASGAEQLLGKSVFDLFHRESHTVISDRIERLLRAEVLSPVEETIVRLDGTAIDVEVNSTVLDESGAIQVIATARGRSASAGSATRRMDTRASPGSRSSTNGW